MRRVYLFLFLILLYTFASAASVNDLLIKGGKAYGRTKYGAALDYYKQAAAQEPKSERALYNSAAAEYKLKNYASAAQTYQNVAGAGGEFEQNAYFNAGNAHYRAADKAAAAAAYRRAILLNPGDAEAVHNLQIVLQQNEENKSDNKDQDDNKDKDNQQDPQGQDNPGGGDMSKQDAQRLVQMAKEQELKDLSRSRQQYGEGGAAEKDW